MLTAEKLRQSDRVNYLLYLWYVEDVVRAYGCDIDRLERDYLPRFQAEGEQYANLRKWYADICDMMHAEGRTEKGHLQIVQGVEQELLELHQRLLHAAEKDNRFADYGTRYQALLPALVELRSRTDKEATDLHAMLGALYWMIFAALKKQEVSQNTTEAIRSFGELLQMLSAYYLKDKKEPIDWDKIMG